MRSWLFLFCATAACGRAPVNAAVPWTPVPAPDHGPVVARVGEVPVFAAEVAAQAARTGKTARMALDDLVAFHLLAERLRTAWPPVEPTAAEAHRQILVQRLLERELEPKTREADLPEADVRLLYERARDTFVHARQVEVAVLDITVGQRASAEARAEARQAAIALRAQAGKARNPQDFMALAAEPAWQAKRVRYFRFFQGPGKPYSARFGAEVAKLKKAGEMSGVIEDEYGVYLAQYVSERPAESTPFEKVRGQLRDAYYPRWRQSKFQEFVDGLTARHEVEVHSGRLIASPGS